MSKFEANVWRMPYIVMALPPAFFTKPITRSHTFLGL